MVRIDAERRVELRPVMGGDAELVNYALGRYASKDYVTRMGLPASVADLGAHDLVGYVEDPVYSPALNYAAEITRNWPARFEVASALGQTEAVREGAGIGILHAFIARTDDNIVPILPDSKTQPSLLDRPAPKHQAPASCNYCLGIPRQDGGKGPGDVRVRIRSTLTQVRKRDPGR